MRDPDDREAGEAEGLTRQARRAGLRHLILGFLTLLFLLFVISWCSLPAR
jgi:hypothetical protein